MLLLTTDGVLVDVYRQGASVHPGYWRVSCE